LGTINERQQRKIIELRRLASKIGHSIQGGKHEFFGARGRETRYELFDAMLAIGITRTVT